jgi:hypothetical protein
VLSNADEFYFDDTCTFRVAVYHIPHLGPVPEPLAGALCPICATGVNAGDRCLVCSCGAPLHAAEDETVEGALACVRLTRECPRCQQVLRLTPAYDGEETNLPLAPDHA